MSGVYLCSYKANAPGLHAVVSVGIRLLDRAPYSHTELAVGNPLQSVAKCYSASGLDGGVRVKDMRLAPASWDVLHLPFVTPDVVEIHYRLTRGQRYDYFGTGRFALPWLLREHPSRWFCSEWALAALGVQDAWRFSPAGAHALALSLGAAPLINPESQNHV